MDPAELKYAPTHEWCKLEDGSLLIGLTPQGLAAVGDIIYIELPEAGEDVLHEIPFGEIDGSKGRKDLISPADGMVLESNVKLAQNPDLLAKKPFAEGWLIRLKPDAPGVLDHLMSAQDYEDMSRKRKGK